MRGNSFISWQKRKRKKIKKNSCVWLHYNYELRNNFCSLRNKLTFRDATISKMTSKKWAQKLHTDFAGKQVVVLWNFGCFLRLQLSNGRDITLFLSILHNANRGFLKIWFWALLGWIGLNSIIMSRRASTPVSSILPKSANILPEWLGNPGKGTLRS